jgi:hypothetical protein
MLIISMAIANAIGATLERDDMSQPQQSSPLMMPAGGDETHYAEHPDLAIADSMWQQ